MKKDSLFMEEILNNKKIIPFKVLEILQEKTDEEHRLSQQEIVKRLQDDYDLVCDRRTVANSLEMLAGQLNFDIDRDNRGYCLLDRDFEDAELRMLIDSVLFSKVLTKSQAERLLEKIKNLGNVYFRQSVPEIKMLGWGIGWSQNPHFLQSVTKLNEAIHKKRQVEFSYLKYDENLQLRETGYKYLVNPYYLVAANGFYFLLGNYDKYDTVSYYRIDRIGEMKILDTKVKPKKQVKGLTEIWDLPKHMKEHIYMFSGKSVDVDIVTTADMVSDFVDYFGKDIRIKRIDKEKIKITVRSNEKAIFYWLLQYGMYVEVIKPRSLRDRMKEAAQELARKYC